MKITTIVKTYYEEKYGFNHELKKKKKIDKQIIFLTLFDIYLRLIYRGKLLLITIVI